MPLALMIVMVAALLSAALFAYAMTDSLHVKKESDAEKAKYLAKSAAEAALKAWRESPANARLSGDTETIYQLTDGSFKNQLNLLSTDKTIGKVDVTVTNKTNKSAELIATAVVNGTTKRVKVTTSAYSNGDGLSPAWYNKINGVFIPPAKYTSTSTVEGQTITIKYGDPGEIVVCDADDDFELPSSSSRPDNNNNKVGYVAQSIFFKDQLSLNKYYDNGSNNKGILVVSGQTIVFEKGVRLYYTALSGEFSTLILHVPKSLGIKLQGKSGLYGKVYFGDSVTAERLIGTTTILDRGSYYFKLKEVGGKEVGINLLDWYFRDIYSYDSNDLFKMDDNDANKAVPDPKDTISYIWDW
jgi:hypothetical protein